MNTRKGIIAVITAATVFIGGFSAQGSDPKEQDSAYVTTTSDSK